MRGFLSSAMRRGFFGSSRFSSSLSSAANKLARSSQEAALEERCILVDELDRVVGDATKRDCHRADENGKVALHRAFSVFLFDEKGRMLIQKRAPSKITFPDRYTNSCCSHPLADIAGEADENLALGVKRAAVRRLNYELGIPTDQVGLGDLCYLTRIHYSSTGDGEWGEHEIDYVLFLRKASLSIDPNPDEISKICWISEDKIREFVRTADAPLTPWFDLILRHELPLWWQNLNNLTKFENHASIRRFS